MRPPTPRSLTGSPATPGTATPLSLPGRPRSRSLRGGCGPIPVQGREVRPDEGPGRARPETIPPLTPRLRPDGTITAANAWLIAYSAAPVLRATGGGAQEPLSRAFFGQ